MKDFYLVCGDDKGQSTGKRFNTIDEAKEHARDKCSRSVNKSDKYYILKPVYFVSSEVKFDEGKA